jgi:hypothetical protein
MPGGDLTRVGASVVALAAGVAAVVLVAELLSRTPGPVQAAAPAASPAAPAPAPPAFPAPPAGAVVFARADGSNVLALAARPSGTSLLLQASVVGPQGRGVAGLEASFSLGNRTARAAACGPGCYRTVVPAAGRPAAVLVKLRGGPAATSWRVALPGRWPPADATELIGRAGRVWRSLRSLTYRERLASDPAHAVTSVWRVAAPDRLAYQVKGGYASVVIGGRRWDRAPGGRWIESSQSSPVRQPVPFWQAVADAHVLGSGRVGGRATWRVSFFDRATPAWFEVSLDKRTLHTLELSMVATAHFMHDVYGGFDEPAGIRPPG